MDLVLLGCPLLKILKTTQEMTKMMKKILRKMKVRIYVFSIKFQTP